MKVFNLNFSSPLRQWVKEGHAPLATQAKALIVSSGKAPKFKNFHGLGDGSRIPVGALRPPRDFASTQVQRSSLEWFCRDIGYKLAKFFDKGPMSVFQRPDHILDELSYPRQTSLLIDSSVRTRSEMFRDYLSAYHQNREERLAPLVGPWEFTKSAGFRINKIGHRLRFCVSEKKYAQCFENFLDATIGYTASEEQAIKRLQRAKELYRPEKFRPYFEAPVLSEFRGLNGGSGALYERHREDLKYLVDEQRFVIEYLLESLSEPGFYQKMSRSAHRRVILVEAVDKAIIFGHAFVESMHQYARALLCIHWPSFLRLTPLKKQ